MPNRLSIEIGGTKLQAAIGNSRGELLHVKRCAVPRGMAAHEICGLILDLVRELEGRESLECTSIGFGGPVDPVNGRVVCSFQIPGWEDFPLKAWAEERFCLPCLIENDTNCGALAEALLGAGRGADVVFYSNLGSGIGGGLVINGTLYTRPLGASEIGHTHVWDTSSSRHVHVEDLCSGWSIGRIARSLAAKGQLSRVLALAGGKVDEITAEHVGLAAAQSDSGALSLVANLAGTFALALCNVIAILNPDKIVLGGGVSLMGDLFLKPLREAVASSVFEPFAYNYEIVPAELGENVVLVGALLL